MLICVFYFFQLSIFVNDFPDFTVFSDNHSRMQETFSFEFKDVYPISKKIEDTILNTRLTHL